MKKLKDWPLALQIWGIFALIIAIIFLLLSVYFSITIRGFFTNEIYKTIETAQKNTIAKNLGVDTSKEDSTASTSSNDIRDVKHVRFYYSSNETNLTKIEKFIPDEAEAKLLLKRLNNQVKNQSNVTQRYTQKTSSGRMLYVIRKIENNKRSSFIVSYMWDTYRNSLAANLIKRIFLVMFIALIISLIAAKYLAQKLVIPLRELESKVKKIGRKQWLESIDIDRKDEIGELSKSIEEMRKELVIQDEHEQAMLQQASHDLKTPLMVIRSYVKAVEDGIYPKGDLESTMKVIDSEAERMQKRIKNLLYFTKIQYMSRHQDKFEKVYIYDLVEKVVDSFTYNNRNIKFDLDIKDIEVIGDEEQWAVVFENIIDNGLRYAKSLIKIRIYEDAHGQYITIYNDGEKIPQNKLGSIFGAFEKDKGGNFGLGLDIVRRIVSMYKGTIKAENEETGVSFVITLRR